MHAVPRRHGLTRWRVFLLRRVSCGVVLPWRDGASEVSRGLIHSRDWPYELFAVSPGIVDVRDGRVFLRSILSCGYVALEIRRQERV